MSFGSQPTLGDLISAIRADRGLTDFERNRVISQVNGLVGFSTSKNTKLSELMSKGLGGIIGALIGKYFGLSTAGRLMSAAAGFGIGSAIHNRLNKPPPVYRGYKTIGF